MHREPFLDWAEPQPVNMNVRGTRDDEDHRRGHVGGTEHAGATGQVRHVIGIDRIPDIGIGRTRREERHADAGAAVLGHQDFVQSAQAELRRRIGRIAGKAE